MNDRLLTTVVGSYPQPDWLVDRQVLFDRSVPRTRLPGFWRIPDEHLQQAQDDATLLAVRDLERAGVDVVTDGEIRRESYSNRFATALGGLDLDNPGQITRGTSPPTAVPRVVGPIRRLRPVQVGDVEFLRFVEEGGVVELRLLGACEDCPISMMTLKEGIERRLKSGVPGVTAVEAV